MECCRLKLADRNKKWKLRSKWRYKHYFEVVFCSLGVDLRSFFLHFTLPSLSWKSQEYDRKRYELILCSSLLRPGLWLDTCSLPTSLFPDKVVVLLSTVWPMREKAWKIWIQTVTEYWCQHGYWHHFPKDPFCLCFMAPLMRSSRGDSGYCVTMGSQKQRQTNT